MRVMYCFDGSDASKAAAPTVRMLGEAPGANVEVVRVVRIPLARTVKDGGVPPTLIFGGAAAADIYRVAAERRWEENERLRQTDIDFMAAAALQECEALLPDLPTGTTVNIIMTDRDIAETLIEHARVSTDIVVMGTHSRAPIVELFVGSVARALVASGVVPVTLIHPRPA